jgi:hypothetical protein
MFQWLEDRNLMLQTIPFVDDIGLVVECCEVGDCTRQLECIARDAIRCGSENKVEFEVGKTEIPVFSQRRKVFQAAKDAVVRVGEQTFATNKSVQVGRILLRYEAIFKPVDD